MASVNEIYQFRKTAEGMAIGNLNEFKLAYEAAGAARGEAISVTSKQVSDTW